MTFPIRCFTCNKCIGQYEEKYNNMVEKGVPKNEIFKILNSIIVTIFTLQFYNSYLGSP